MNKEILIQYCEIMEEIKDIRRRIQKLDKFLKNPPIVSDMVRGSRRDGTIGPIKVTGIPEPEYQRKERLYRRYKKLLELREKELLDLTCKVEEYIDKIPKSELRILMRLFCIDGLSYVAIANRMNCLFPKRHIKYTDENVRKRIQRFFDKNSD